MPVYDYKCLECKGIEEFILSIIDSEDYQICSSCGGNMSKIITASGQYCGNEDADWLKCVPDVIDPEGGRAAKEFKKNPTRSNYKNWMKEAGVRPLENNEQMKPTPTNMDKVNETVIRKHFERMTDPEYKRRSEKILREGVGRY